MFDYVTKSDADERQSVGVQVCGGFAVLGVLAGTLCLLSGLTALALTNYFLAISAGVAVLRMRKTRR